MTAYTTLITGTSGLTNYWRFEGNGTATTGALNVTLATGYTAATAAKDGTGLTANSTTSKTGSTVGVANTFFNSTYSIEFWFKVGSYRSSQQAFMRMSNELALEVQTDGTLYYYYNGSGVASPGTVDDNVWHHLVITRDGSRNVIMYLDGTSVATFTAPTGAPGSASLYVGGSQYTTQPIISGQMDEVALYNTALSSATVLAHYGALNPVSVTVDVDAPTMTLQAKDAVAGRRVFISPTRDGYASTSDLVTASGTANGAATTLRAGTGNSVPFYASLFHFDVSGIPSSAVVQDANLSIYVSAKTGAGAGATYSLFRLANAYTVENTAPSLATSGSAVTTKADTAITASAYNDFAATSAVAGWVAGTFSNNGLRISSPTVNRYLEINSKEASSDAPLLEVIYAFVPTNVDVTVAAQSMTAQAYDASVETSSVLTQDAATASLTAYDVTVESTLNPNAEINVEAATATLTAQVATAEASTLVEVASVSASAQSYDVTVETTSGVVIDLDTPRMFITHNQLLDVNGEPIEETEEEDRYFTSTMNLTPFIWYRMNATAGTTENARISQGVPNTDPGRYYGATIGLNGGPNGRKYVHFNGSSRFEQFETLPNYLGGESYGPVGSLEFSIRTDKQNQFVMRMDDATTMPLTDRSRAKDIYLKDGKFNLQVWTFNPLTQKNEKGFEFTGYSNLADGEWHHIVLTNDAPGDNNNPYYGISLYVDGELDFHRRYNFGLSFPDFIGGRGALPGLFDPMYAAIPLDSWYVGDVTEVVSFKYALNQDQIFRQNDTLFGYDPVYVEAARANLTAGEATTKTNAKRVLNINLGSRSGVIWEGKEGGSNGVAFQGLTKGGASLETGIQVGQYQFFAVDAYFSPVDAPGPIGKLWWEEQYDVSRMLDLQKDLNLADFDILNVSGYPTTGTDFDDLDRKFSEWSLFGGPSARGQLENLMAQIRTFAINGGGVYLTDPSTAKAVGVIDDYDFVDQLQEQRDTGFDYGNSGGDNDLRAAKLNPWGNNVNGASTSIWAPRTPPYQLTPNVDYDRLAHFYRDEHGNQWQTVRNLVDGLTDIAGFILTDAIEFWSYLDQGGMWAEKWEDRPTGLSVGDTFRIMGTRGAGRGEGPNGFTGMTSRVFGQMGTPITAIKAGIPVTTFAPTYWDKDQAVVNPYRDWATSIVVRPGDTLAGQTVQGRIYVNFTESFADLAAELQTTAVDQIPPNSEIINGLYHETPESREWTYSTWRGSWGNNENQSGGSTTKPVFDQQGNIILTTVQKDTVIGINYTHRWPIKREAAPFLNYRGLAWVGSKQDDSGNANVGVASATMTLQAKEAVVEAKASAVVDVPAARMTLEAYADKDTVAADAVVLVTAPSMTLALNGFTELIDVEPARMTLTAHEDLDGILANADLVVLTLPTASAVLTLEEK